MKTCFKCHEIKSLSEFYAHGTIKDGHVNKCKSCNQNDNNQNHAKKRNDPLWVIKERERSRLKDRMMRELGTKKEYTRKPCASIYKKASSTVLHAIRDKRLFRQP
jgi:hypothetical protein